MLHSLKPVNTDQAVYGATKIVQESPMNLIQILEQEEITRLNKTIPEFAPGDTVIVSVNVVEGCLLYTSRCVSETG